VIRPSALLPSRTLLARLQGDVADGREQRFRAEDRFFFGDVGEPNPEPTLLIALSDDSGSVTGASGTDPLSQRYREMRAAFKAVARRGSRRELGAVLHFDTPCGADVWPTPLTRFGLRRLHRGLRLPRGVAGTSELLPSLGQAIALAQAHPGHEATLVLLSDFMLLDANTQQALDELAQFPGDVHAVVLGGLMIGTLDERIVMSSVMRDDPPGAVGRAVFASLVQHRPGSSVVPLTGLYEERAT